MTAFGNDPFGEATMTRAWDNTVDTIEKAKTRVMISFEIMEKLGIEYFVSMIAILLLNKQ